MQKILDLKKCSKTTCAVLVNVSFILKWYFGLTWLYILSIIAILSIIQQTVLIKTGKAEQSENLCKEETIQVVFEFLYYWSNYAIATLRETVQQSNTFVSQFNIQNLFVLFLLALASSILCTNCIIWAGLNYYFVGGIIMQKKGDLI